MQKLQEERRWQLILLTHMQKYLQTRVILYIFLSSRCAYFCHYHWEDRIVWMLSLMLNLMLAIYATIWYTWNWYNKWQDGAEAILADQPVRPLLSIVMLNYL